MLAITWAKQGVRTMLLGSVQSIFSHVVQICCVPAGLVNPGLQCQSRVATWPTAAAQLMGAPKLQVKSARPASPVSSGSTGSFSNKRRKLDPSHTLLGMTQCTTAWQTNQPAVHSDHVPTRQLERPASHNNNPGVASDADSDPHDPGAAPQHRNAATSLTQAVLSSCHFTDKHIFTAAPDLLASTEHLRSDLVDVECGSEFSNQSPVDDGTSSDASVPVCPTDDRYKQAKGKRCIGPSPLPWYDPQQESKLDHIRMGNWVWWRIDSTWTFARVRSHSSLYIDLLESCAEEDFEWYDNQRNDTAGTLGSSVMLLSSEPTSIACISSPPFAQASACIRKSLGS